MSQRQQTALQEKVFRVIFGTETPAGKWFDIILIVVILTSVAIIMLDSIPRLHAVYGALYLQIEWVFTILFTIEYLTRLWCTPNRRGYVLSLYGIVDLLALLPTYLSLLLPQAAPLLIIRLLRILRIFRVLRLLTLLNEANELAVALRNSGRKIFVFFTMMMIITTIFGCLLYVIEGPEHGFASIPGSIYWAIVTITTVGYGDMVPATPLGRAISSVGMLIGYAVIAVPTGIVTAELTFAQQRNRMRQIRDSRNCTNCASVESDPHARYCRNCGSQLPRPGHEPEPAKQAGQEDPG
jgi:voltage-gated potassium channel